MLKQKNLTLLAITTILFLALHVSPSFGEATGGQVSPLWTVPNLPHRCTAPDCETSSPVLADLTGDGIPDIVLATSNGHIVAVRSNGVLLWDRDTAPHFGMAANSQQINSSPAVADIDGNGDLEIVVGVGTIYGNTCTQGGVIAYDHNGNFLWRFLTFDEFTLPSGCRDTVYSTPAVGDLDNDGSMEIVVGAFDKRIYVLHHNGALDSHFPIDSYHILRFPDWDGLDGHLADTIWGSASLADMNGDGFLDILMSTDEGNFDENFPPPDGWDCPYQIPPHPWPQDYCGGALYVVDRFGNHLPGFPKRIHDIMQSSTAVTDINNDGSPEIFVGGGTFYYNNSPDHPSTAFRIWGWDSQGNDLPGWQGGKVTTGSTPASPSVGDITGDGAKEVIALDMDQKLYAWFANGQPVPGFPMTPRSMFGSGNAANVGITPILGDYDGDGKMEIFVRTGPNVTIVDGNGQQLTASQNPPNAPAFYTNSIMQNNAALGDIDNDGKLELIAFNSTLYAWDLPNATNSADWPMYRYNAARTGHPQLPRLHIAPSTLTKLHEIGDNSNVQMSFTLQGIAEETINWTAVAPSSVTLSPNNGEVDGTPTAVSVTVSRASLNPGVNHRTITINGTINGQPVSNSPVEIAVTIYLVDEIFPAYLPVVRK